MIRIANAIAVVVLVVSSLTIAVVPATSSVHATQGSLSKIERELAAAEAATAFGDIVVVQDPNGISYGLDLATGAERWRFNGGSVGYFPPYLLGDQLLIGNNAGDLFVLEPDTGTLRWEYTATSLVYPPVSDGTTFYAGGSDGSLYAFEPATGEPRWVTPLLEWGVVGPALANGRLFVSSRSSEELIAVDAATGQELWRIARLGLSHLPPIAAGDVAITGMAYLLATDGATGAQICDSSDIELRNFFPYDGSGTVYAAFGDGGAGAYDVATCETRWSTDLDTPNFLPAVVDEGVVFVSSPLYRSADAFDAQSGDKLWERGEANADAFLYFGAGAGTAYIAQGSLEAASGATGNVYWRFSANSAIASNPYRTGEVVIAGSLDGMVYALHANTGVIAWQFQAAASNSPEDIGPRA